MAMLIEVVDLPSEALELEITIIFLFSFFNTAIRFVRILLYASETAKGTFLSD